MCAQSGNKCCPYLDLSGSCACGIWPKESCCKMLFPPALLQILILAICRQITADCDRGCVNVSICRKTDFCCRCACEWNRIILLISWGLLRTELVQEPHLLCIALDGHFYTNSSLPVPRTHRQVFLLAMIPKKTDNICSITYLQLFPILV